MGLFSGETRRDTVQAWAFVLVQAGLLLAIVVLPGGDAWTTPQWLDQGARLLQWLGLAILAVAFVNLGRSLTPLPTPVPHGELRTGGLYRFVRHPIYTGVLALAVGAAIRSASVAKAVAAALLTLLFMAKARWEEQRLADRYADYEEYARTTPRFVPFWPVRGRSRGERSAD